MKKTILLAALGLVVLAGCTQSDEVFQGPDLQKQALEDNAITFGTYMGNSTLTRTVGGEKGALTTDKLKSSESQGFGVFAYYTGKKAYANDASAAATNGTTVQNSMKANFMFNQQVTWKSSLSEEFITKWIYSPMKYWPNEVANGAVDDQDNDTGSDPATTEYSNGGNLSFFAYAPYVDLNSTAWTQTEGIIAINGKKELSGENGANNVATDPILTYVVPTEANEIVDLLWGTYGATSSNVLGGGNAGVAYNENGSLYEKSILPHYTNAGQTTYDGYRLNADLTKQKTNGKVDIAFKHALAKVGGSSESTSSSGTPHGLMIIADIDDQKGAESGGTKSTATKITVTDIQIEARSLYKSEGTPGSNDYLKKMQGDFNLATGQWGVLTTENTGDSENAGKTNHNVTSPASSTSITSSASLNTSIAEPSSVGTTWDNVPTGVTTTAQNVYEEAEANPLVFIPGTYPELTITINYTVRSWDSKLASGAGKNDEGTWTYVKQVIKKKVTFKNPVELNKQYSLLIHLGLTSVKFSASVSDWDVAGDTNGNGSIDTGEELIVEDAYLPINVSGTIYHFTSYNAETDGTEYGHGVAILTGKTKTFNSTTYYEAQVQYNSVDGWAGRKFYVATPSGNARAQLYNETGVEEGVWVTLTEFEPKTYNFTSYNSQGATTQYSTGTAQTTGLMKKIGTQEFYQIRILTNPAYPSWEGQTYYIQWDATAGDTAYQLYNEEGKISVWVKISE